MSAAPLPFEFALVGAGRVGSAVALLLSAAGHKPVGVASRSTASAERAAAAVDAPVFDLDEPIAADVYLIGTPLDAVKDTAVRASRGAREGSIFVHFAGAAGIEPLKGLGRAAALHPVQACPDVEAGVRNLPGSAWGVTCSPGLERWSQRFVADLDGLPVAVREEDRPVWHAAAVVTSNGIAALFADGELILEELGIESPERVLGPLAAGTVANARLGGGGAATLTGPVVRGETATIDAHFETLKRRREDLAAAYRDASLLVLRAAHRAGRIPDADFEQMTGALR